MWERKKDVKNINSSLWELKKVVKECVNSENYKLETNKNVYIKSESS